MDNHNIDYDASYRTAPYKDVLLRLQPEYSKLVFEYLMTNKLENIIEHLDKIFEQLYPNAIIKSLLIPKETNRIDDMFDHPYLDYKVRW